MEYVHNNTQSKTISKLGYEFYIFTNTNLGGKKHTRPWKMRIDCLLSLFTYIKNPKKKERNIISLEVLVE